MFRYIEMYAVEMLKGVPGAEKVHANMVQVSVQTKSLFVVPEV